MIRRFIGELPKWARFDHPILRYELTRNAGELRPRARYLRALGTILALLALLAGGYLYATDFLRQPSAGENLTDSLWRVLYFPALALTLLLRVSVISTTVNTVSEERRRERWDNLRATEAGAELALRTRWVAVFYRFRGLVALLMLARVILIIGILYDLTAFRGGYLSMLTANITPEVSVVFGVVLLSLIMTASTLLVWTGTGLDAAVGLFASALIKQRLYTAMFQILFIAIRLFVPLALLIAVTQFIVGGLQLEAGWLWLLILAFVVTGDWGMILLQLAALGEIWARVPYSIFIGVAMLVIVLLQALITDGLLAYAVRHAERHE